MLATRAREFFTYVFFSTIFFVTCTKWSWSCIQEKGFDKEASVVYISRTTTKSEFEEWIQSLQQKYTYVKTCYWNCVYSWNSIFFVCRLLFCLTCCIVLIWNQYCLPFNRPESYHMVYNNCIKFVEDVCLFLGIPLPFTLEYIQQWLYAQ